MNEKIYGDRFLSDLLNYPEQVDDQMKRRILEFVKTRKDAERLTKYFHAVFGWYDGARGEPQYEKILIKGTGLLKTCMPPAKFPKVLYRGLAHLNKCPSEGQSLLYSPNKKRILTSWTEVVEVADDYDFSGEGVVLSVPFAEYSKKAQVVLWPGPLTDRQSAYEHESEWVLYIRSPMKVGLVELKCDMRL